MELYAVVGLDGDNPPAWQKLNEMQEALREYSFPPPNMVGLRERENCDHVTFERMLGAAEATRRRATGTAKDVAPVPEEPAGSGDILLDQIRRQGVSSEAWAGGGKAAAAADGDHAAWQETPKTAEEIARLRQLTSSSILFKGLDSRDRTSLFNALLQESFPPGMDIIKQGEVGNEYYIIDIGKCQVSVSKDGTEDEEEVVGKMGSGESFGELGLMYGTARAATITAMTDVVCWVLDRDTYRGILMNIQVQKRQRYMAFLDTVNMFQPLQPYEKARIADMLQPAELPPQTEIIREGENGDTFYIVEDGLVEVSTAEQGTLSTLGAGCFFGELALIYSQPRKATVRTLQTTHLVSLDRKSFRNYLGSITELLKDVATQYAAGNRESPGKTLTKSTSLADVHPQVLTVLDNCDDLGHSMIFDDMAPSTPSDAGSTMF
eukprot:TRINITY_DN1523_c0_g3_i1.p1 TRINITY_DN1523_c0_g3~~TRINITY_DN1523_c0_g3_i1.p1  ORF type:complete len:435 (+),score=171.54 TRINITY_DN1523_c0_g3_i1:393-1697(+)